MALRVILTGASSFSGYWFVRELAARGHEVVAPLSRHGHEYEGVRGRRVSMLASLADVVHGAPVGSRRFLECLEAQDHVDVLAIHHAVVGDYRSAEFDVGSAVQHATAGAPEISKVAAAKGATVAMLTRSVFEADQGLGNDPRAIGLYAVAKSATVGVWAEHARRVGLVRSDFTVTNPFGPFEEPRLVRYLANMWVSDETPLLRAPSWVRDNIPVPLLAADYATSVERAAGGAIVRRVPSHLVASNLDYARRIGDEFGSRWGIACSVGVATPTDTGEPEVRIGVDRVDWADHALDESEFWDEFAEYYAPQSSSVAEGGSRHAI